MYHMNRGKTIWLLCLCVEKHNGHVTITQPFPNSRLLSLNKTFFSCDSVSKLIHHSFVMLISILRYTSGGIPVGGRRPRRGVDSWGCFVSNIYYQFRKPLGERGGGVFPCKSLRFYMNSWKARTCTKIKSSYFESFVTIHMRFSLSFHSPFNSPFRR